MIADATSWLAPLVAQSDFFTERGPGSEASCVADNQTVCWGWAFDNFDQFTGPLVEHLVLVALSVGFGFAIALGMAVISHNRRWLVPTFTGASGVIYTIPSIALFLILLPITGRGTVTAVIALTLYTLQIIYRNIVTGLGNVPDSAKDAGRGMGMTDRQLLWRVELPLAVPEIIAGLRIATVSTVAIATLAIFAGAGGLGESIYNDGLLRDVFKTTIVVASALAIAMAILFDALYVLAQRKLAPWRQVRAV